jgi:peptidoglycan/LPS O-acetylase OafA/YrhL
MRTGAQPDKSHIPALDGIRGLAIILVLVGHLADHFKPGNAITTAVQRILFAGWTGVDLFFVLSGFLITGILWDAKADTHYFLNFYARRTVRIFPIYYFTLALIFLVLPLLLPWLGHLTGRLAEVGREQIGWFVTTRAYWGWYVTYFVDFLVAWKGFKVAIPGHFWSLAVEEHFYLVWPCLVYFLRFRALVAASVALVAGALMLRVALYHYFSQTAIYVLTPCRMDGLALGALIALLARSPGGLRKLAPLALRVLAVTAVIWAGVMLGVTHEWSQYGPIAQTLGYTLTIFFYGSFLVVALTQARVGAWLSGKTLRFFGKYSYALYIFHVFAFLFFARFFAFGDVSRYSMIHTFSPGASSVAERGLWLTLDALLYILLAVGVSVLLALLSWNFLEQPCLRLKRYFPMKTKPGPAAAPSAPIISPADLSAKNL